MLGTFRSNSAQGSGLLEFVGSAAYATPSTSATSHTLPIPEGSSGDTLIAFVFAVQNDVGLTPSAGWSVIDSIIVDSNDPFQILQRTAVSDTTLVVTASASTKLSAVVYRFANVTAVEDTISAEATNDSTINFPAHTATDGDRFIWVRCYNVQKGSSASTWASAPSGYSNVVQCVGDSAIIQTARKENTTAAESAGSVSTTGAGLVQNKTTTTLVVY